jgi:hypothetical protein
MSYKFLSAINDVNCSGERRVVECATASTITAIVEQPAPAGTGGTPTSDHALFGTISTFMRSAFEVLVFCSSYKVLLADFRQNICSISDSRISHFTFLLCRNYVLANFTVNFATFLGRRVGTVRVHLISNAIEASDIRTMNLIFF